MSDPDAGDMLASADWEIRLDPSGVLVWFETGSAPVHAVHSHFGDGAFSGPYAGRSALETSTQYRLRVRHRDNTGLYSAWSELVFTTSDPSVIEPFVLDGVPSGSPVSLEAMDGSPVFLPDGPDPGCVRIEAFGGGTLAVLRGTGGVNDSVIYFPGQASHFPVRVCLFGGGGSLHVPECRLKFPGDAGVRSSVFLPETSVLPGDTARYWIAEDGSAWHAGAGDAGPAFSQQLSFRPIPWQARQAGFIVERVATGFQLPMAVAMLPNPGPGPADPLLYVAELYGRIKLVRRNGSVSTYADNLLNFNPTGLFPGSGEQGIGGMCIEPATGDLFVTMVYDGLPPVGPHYPRIVRLHSTDGGLTAASNTIVRDFPGELVGESHYISNITIGPDGKLFVHVGEGEQPELAMDLTTIRGKILRLNQDGSAPADNPFYNLVNGLTAIDLVYAFGFRNPFGGVWRQSDGAHFEVENGPNANDRLARVEPGSSYAWNGDPASMTVGAIYNWPTPHAPVAIACTEPGVQGGSGFPVSKQGHLFVTESGPTYAPGAQARGKRIVEFAVDGSGALESGPTPLVEYMGYGRATAAGLAAGVDGLYFTDLYLDHGETSPIDPGANLFRVRYVGGAPAEPDFVTLRSGGNTPSNCQFSDLNPLAPGPRSWNFGDGSGGVGLDPSHWFSQTGLYTVKLTIGSNGKAVTATRKAVFLAGGRRRGLRAQYFRGMFQDVPAFERTEPGIDVNFAMGSPGGTVPADTFSVRWTGKLVPEFTETYTLHLTSDDGARMWLNGVLVLDHYLPQAATDWTISAALHAGVAVDIRVEAFEAFGVALCKLAWSSPNRPLEPVPGSRCYWVDPALELTATPAIAPLAVPVLRILGGNPRHGDVQLEFEVPGSGRATLGIFDVQGRRVATLHQGPIVGGQVLRAMLPGSRLSSGIYFARLSWDGGTLTRRWVNL